MAVDVRQGLPDHVPGIKRVARRAWYAAHAPIIGPGTVEDFLAEHYDEASLESAIRDEDAILDVAVDDSGTVVGFVSATPTDEVATFALNRVYVHPDRWGEGVGRSLLTEVERAIDESGGDRIRLAVMAENDRAVAFYEAAGYDLIEEFYDDRIETRSYRYAKDL